MAVVAVPERRVVVVWDVLTVLAFAVAAVSFLWLGTWMDADPVLADKALFAVALLTTGIMMGRMFTAVRLDMRLEAGQLTQIAMWTALALAGIVLASLAAPMSTLGWQFAVLIAAAEEAFFRFFITSMLAAWGGKALGVAGSAVVFALYHTAVYGITTTLVQILLAGAILAYVYLESGSLTPTLLAHMAVNYLATA